MANQPYLLLRDIRKSFSGVPVLKGINFSAEAGEVHGFLGGNGAGKSTLMNILGGIYTKDAGEIFIDGKKVEITSASKADEVGISFVHQELKLFDQRSIAENIMMSRLPGGKGPFGIINDKKKNAEAKKWLDMVGLNVPETMPVGELSIAEQQMVEIAKALSLNAKIIIFDEPTSSLTSGETQNLFKIIRRLKAEGVCIIYISHKFDEIFEICDRVTVLRDGMAIDTLDVARTDSNQLVSLVIGRKLEQYFPHLPPAPGKDAEAVLSVRDFTNSKLKNVSFDLRKGEILGLFGLVGAGRSEVMRGIFGLDYLASGSVEINGTVRKIKSPRMAMRNGISFLTENRREEGLVLKLAIRENLVLPILKRLLVPGIGYVRKGKEKAVVADAFKQFMIRAEGPAQRVSRLSGGNQQKVVLAKWFMTESQILMLDEPTRGVDVGAKAEIYQLIVDAVEKRRMSVILASCEAPEILGICHRILVMRDGEIIAEYAKGEAEEEELLIKCSGGDKQ